MKKTTFVFVLLVVAVLMVLPTIHAVNYPAINDVEYGSQIADGSPRPVPLPPPPPGLATDTLIADGWPVPLPPSAAETLVADGWPVPLPPSEAEALVH